MSHMQTRVALRAVDNADADGWPAQAEAMDMEVADLIVLIVADLGCTR